MNKTLEQPTTQAEQDEVDYGENLIWKLVGSKIAIFGANANGEIFLAAEKNGEVIELIIGKDEQGEVSIFEVEKGADHE